MRGGRYVGGSPATERPWRPRWLDDPGLLLALAAEHGWTSVALTPSSAERIVHGVARLACGHELRSQVSEREFTAAGRQALTRSTPSIAPSAARRGGAIASSCRRTAAPARAERADHDRHAQLLHLVAMTTSPTGTCRGCSHFHLDAPPGVGQDAHHTRLLLALDLSLAAACRSRGVAAWLGPWPRSSSSTRSSGDIGSLLVYRGLK